MAEEKPTLHVDTDWKKQAQEEKRKLAEEEQKKAQAASSPGRPGGEGGGDVRAIPPASFASLVQSIVTQALFYLGDLAPRGGEPVTDLDMAKHHVDTLAMLEEKTRNNVSEEEKRLLDAALYETRMRYVSVASRQIV
jgi:hypothetical protein